MDRYRMHGGSFCLTKDRNSQEDVTRRHRTVDTFFNSVLYSCLNKLNYDIQPDDERTSEEKELVSCDFPFVVPATGRPAFYGDSYSLTHTEEPTT